MGDDRDRREATRDEPAAPGCPVPGQDEVCSDEVRHDRGPVDPAMLDGSVLDVGSAMAGLMPVELPRDRDKPRGDSGGCDECG